MAFKKPLSNVKTSAPLRSSDRRKLKQRVVQLFALSPEDGELLVPDGLQSVKFSTHLDEPGVAYLAPDGDPLWFTLGKGSDELIPTVYTLWKHATLLPCLTTPAAVIPVLMGGADLMIPGVVAHPPALRVGQLVSIAQYTSGAVPPPLAVGHTAADTAALAARAKGKAVLILHTAGDRLWEMGARGTPPDAIPLTDAAAPAEEAVGNATEDDNVEARDAGAEKPPGDDEAQAVGEQATPSEEGGAPADETPDGPVLSPQEVSALLRKALLQAIQTTLSALPPSAFPMASTTLYTAHILPARPVARGAAQVDVRHSAHKSLSAFLRAAEKDGLLRLKDVRGRGGDGAPVVAGVFAMHTDVQGHAPHATVGDADARAARREQRSEAERARVRELGVVELWKPHQHSVRFFAEGGKDTSALYTLSEVKTILNAYITAKSLVNAREQQYVNVDELLQALLASKSGETLEFLKREDALKRLLDKMQPWHRIEAEGHEPALRKGQLKPVSVTVKMRQGRKACTLVTDFEPFLLVADALADELRHLCASSTSVTPLPGKSAGLEVMVQGKQIKAVTELLLAKGVPKKWIESADLSDKKAKK